MAADRRFFQKRDSLVILALLLVAGAAALIFYFAGLGGNGSIAQIYVSGKLYREIDLSRVTETEIIEIDARLHVEIEVSPGAIKFVHSDCPDKICIHAGTLTKPPQSAVCLPAGVAVKVVARSGAASIDAQAG